MAHPAIQIETEASQAGNTELVEMEPLDDDGRYSVADNWQDTDAAITAYMIAFANGESLRDGPPNPDNDVQLDARDVLDAIQECGMTFPHHERELQRWIDEHVCLEHGYIDCTQHDEMAEFHWTPKQIKATRESLGLSQQAFATRLGVSVASVSGWERGVKRPSGLAVKQLEAQTSDHNSRASRSLRG